MEASRRIELLYTDLQSLALSFDFNKLANFSYQDKPRTEGEPDTPKFMQEAASGMGFAAQRKADEEAVTSTGGIKNHSHLKEYGDVPLKASIGALE